MIDENSDRLAHIAQKVLENQRGANNKKLDSKYFREFNKLCPINNQFALHTIMLSYLHGVRRVRSIESYTPSEIKRVFDKSTTKTFTPKDYVIKFARFIKTRNKRMGETIHKLRVNAESDPHYKNSSLKAIVILGAGHGGTQIDHGVHNSVVQGLTNSGFKTSIGVVRDFNKKVKPNNFNELLEHEAMQLAQKTSAEIDSYTLPKHLADLEKTISKRMKEKK
jgi:hypothetical protein